MRFSLLGLITAVAVLAPNFLLLVCPPRTEMRTLVAPVALTWVERAGQVSCLVVPVITVTGDLSWWWLPPMILALAGYYALWGRYLLRGRTIADLYRPLGKIPAPMAILPVFVFLFAAAWLRNPWVAGAAAILAAGHIPTSLLIARHQDPSV